MLKNVFFLLVFGTCQEAFSQKPQITGVANSASWEAIQAHW